MKRINFNSEGSSLCFKNLNVTNSTLERIDWDGLIQEDSLKKHLCQILYSRYFLRDLNSSERKSKIQNLLDSKQEKIDELGKQHTFQQARMLLVSLFAIHRDKSSNYLPAGMLSLADTMNLLPRWNDPAMSYICLWDEPHRTLKMHEIVIQRVQRSGICFIFAVAMLQHYLIAKFNGSEASPPILDVKIFLVENAGNEMLESYILNRGGRFARLMTEIFQQDSMHFTLKIVKVNEYHLKKYGPALLNIKIPDGDKSFGVAGKLVYTDFPKCENCPADMHDMLLIGIRWESGSRRFLIQNWWPDHQFLEATQEFLVQYGAVAIFIYAPQYTIRYGLPQTRAMYDEL
jgi:hypothetical protein